MECIHPVNDGTAENAKLVTHRLRLQSIVNVDYCLMVAQPLGVSQTVLGIGFGNVADPLGIGHTVVHQHAVPYTVTSNLGLGHTLVYAGEGLGGPGGGGAGDATQLVWSTLNAGIPGAGSRYMTHDGDVAHSDTPIVLADSFTLTQATIAVDQADSTNTYAVRIYDQSGPTLVATMVTLAATNLKATATSLSISLPAGDYGVTMERTAGSGKSDFDEAVLNFLIEKV